VEALRDGRADLSRESDSAVSVESEFLFSTEMETVPVSIFVRKSNNSISSLTDLRGKKVAVIKGSSAEATLKINNPDLILEYFSTIESALIH
jgi:ABC-type amino acid transport substrate-binding protein